MKIYQNEIFSDIFINLKFSYKRTRFTWDPKIAINSFGKHFQIGSDTLTWSGRYSVSSSSSWAITGETSCHSSPSGHPSAPIRSWGASNGFEGYPVLFSVHSFAGNVSLRWMIETRRASPNNVLGEPTLTAVRKHLSWHFSRAPLRIHVYEPHGRDCRSCSQVRNFCATWYKDAQWQWLQRESFQIDEWSFSRQTKFDRSVSSIYKCVAKWMGNSNLTLELSRYISQMFWTRLSDLIIKFYIFLYICGKIYFLVLWALIVLKILINFAYTFYSHNFNHVKDNFLLKFLKNVLWNYSNFWRILK